MSERMNNSVYYSQILSPTKNFFQAYFKKYPAGKFFRKGEDSLYGRVPVLSGHTGIAKSAFVKRLEDTSTEENLVSVNFGDGVVLQMRPEVVLFKTGSVSYRELEEAVFAISKIGVGNGGAEYLVYQTPFFEKFFRASDQFRYFARKVLLVLIKGKTEDGKEIPPEFRVSVDEEGFAVHDATGIRLEDREGVKAVEKEANPASQALRVVSLIYNAARPAVLFLSQLDRNHALLVKDLTTSFIFNRPFQDELTFYSAFLVAARNRVAPSERDALFSFYITAGDFDLDEGAFMARFEEVYLDPASEEVYRPVVEYLVNRFEGNCEDKEKLCGVKEFLNSLAGVKVETPYRSTYNLLYYVPGILVGKGEEESEEYFNNQKLKGFATFRSYERLLTYLSKKKAEKKPGYQFDLRWFSSWIPVPHF